MDKQELLTLQANLQAEVQAKQQLAEELGRVKANNVANERFVIRNFCLLEEDEDGECVAV